MKLFSRILIFVFLSFVFLSCTAGQDYQRPEIASPEKFVNQDVLERLNEQNPSKTDFFYNWWEGFSDTTLNEMVNLGINNNYSIAASYARLNRAKAILELAASGDSLKGTATVDFDTQQEIELGDGSTDYVDGIFGSLGFILPIDLFGRVTRQEQAAMAEIEFARAELRGNVLKISSDITGEYLRLRGNQRQLLLLEESVELQEKTLSIVQIRYDAGLAPELDVRRAEASVENLRAGIPELEESLVNSRNTIATLTGNFPGEYDNLLSMDGKIPVYTGTIPNIIPADVISLRPDVKQAEADLKQKVAETGVAEAEFYPLFSLIGQIGIGVGGISGLSTMDAFLASIGALLQQVFTDGGARQANLDIAKAEAEESLAEYYQTLLDAIKEVEQNLSALRSSYKRQISLQKAVDASERSSHQAEILYAQGLTSFLDVVDANRVLAFTQQELASARTDYAVQIAILFKVIGTEIIPE